MIQAPCDLPEDVMLASSRISRRGLMAGAALTALTIGAAFLAPVAAKSPADAPWPIAKLSATLPNSTPSMLSADAALEQITGADGVLRFDVAEDGTRFVWGDPRFDDELPAPGASYISHGYIYPVGTLSDEIDGVHADGTPQFPDKVLGSWYCYGWYIGDGAHTTKGPLVLSTQYYTFGSEWGATSLVSEGYVLSETGGTVQRAITGGTGPFAAVQGDMADTSLGFNQTEGANARYAVRLLPAPELHEYLPPSQLIKRPMRGA